MPAKSLDDPFLARLDEISAKRCPDEKSEAWRSIAIATLYCYYYQELKTAFDALSAVVLAGRLEIPAPQSAIDLIEKAVFDCICYGSLDVAFGLKGKGTGETLNAPIPQRMRQYMLDDLCTKVHQLIMAGKTQAEACRLVALEAKDTKKAEGQNPSFGEIRNITFAVQIRTPSRASIESGAPSVHVLSN